MITQNLNSCDVVKESFRDIPCQQSPDLVWSPYCAWRTVYPTRLHAFSASLSPLLPDQMLWRISNARLHLYTKLTANKCNRFKRVGWPFLAMRDYSSKSKASFENMSRVPNQSPQKLKQRLRLTNLDIFQSCPETRFAIKTWTKFVRTKSTKESNAARHAANFMPVKNEKQKDEIIERHV